MTGAGNRVQSEGPVGNHRPLLSNGCDFNRRILKTVPPVVCEGAGAPFPCSRSDPSQEPSARNQAIYLDRVIPLETSF